MELVLLILFVVLDEIFYLINMKCLFFNMYWFWIEIIFYKVNEIKRVFYV